MAFNDGEHRKSAELRRHIVRKTWSSDGDGSVGELKLSSDGMSREG